MMTTDYLPPPPSFPSKIILLRASTVHELLHTWLKRGAEDPGFCSQQGAWSCNGSSGPAAPYEWAILSLRVATCCQSLLSHPRPCLLLLSAPSGASQNITVPKEHHPDRMGNTKGMVSKEQLYQAFFYE